VEVLRTHWPWIVGFLVLVALAYAFVRSRLRAYTDRTRRDLEQYTKPQYTPAVTPLPIPPRNLSDTATLAERKLELWQRIQKYPLEPYPQIELLVHQLACAQIDREFQDVYFKIFGSQYRLLQELNNVKGTGTAPRTAVQELLKKAGEADELIRKHDFNDWIGFLVGSGFVTAGVDSFTLTPKGQDFLVWVTRQQLPARTYEGV
jgi:hypothetical protein